MEPLEPTVVPSALDAIADELGRLRSHLTRPRRTIARRLRLTTTDNPIEIQLEHFWESVLVENPNAGAGRVVEVGFASGNGLPGRSDRRVPPQFAVMIVHRFEHLSIGMDAAQIPGAGAEVFVHLYSEPQAAHAYAFAP